MSKKGSENVCFWLPNQSANKMDVLTPHKMVVVFLIQEYMRLKKGPESGATEQQQQQQQQPPPPAIELTFADRKRFCLLLLKLIHFPDMSYKDLHGLLVSRAYGLHPVHLEEFTKLMKRLKSVGIDVLFDLYNDIDKLIMDNSVLIGIVGLHLRKVFVTMDKMNFQEVMELYQSTIAYYDKGMGEIMANGGRPADQSENPVQLSQYAPIEPSDRGAFTAKWSVKQSELFVAQQSALLKDNEVKALPPDELERRLEEIIHDRPKYAQAYFLQYLNNLRMRDINNAIKALHRAFDIGTTASSGAAANGGSSLPFASENYSKDYQYSNLNLAILHSHFGHRELALTNLQECVTSAQDSKDPTCLHLAHSWIARLHEEDAPLPEKNNISSIHATSLGVLAEIQRAGNTGSKLPSKLLGILMLNDHLNCQRSMMDLVANGIAVRAAIWTVYGNHLMASLCAQILLNADLKLLNKVYNGEGICQVLCSTAVWLAFLGDFNLAIVVLKHAKDRFPSYPLSHDWMVTEHYITVTRALYRGHWAEASSECQRMYGLHPSLAMLQLAHVALAKLDITTAKTIVRRLLARGEKLDPLIRVRALILYANTFFGTRHPHALNVLGDAQELARDYHLQYEDALIELHLGYIFLVHMNVPRQALNPLKASLETILANGPIYDKARAMFTFARALVAAEGTAEHQLAKLTTLLPMFEEAIDYFEKLECYSKAKDVYIYLARTFHSLGELDERNRFSYRYRVLEEQFPTEQQYLNVFF